MKVHTVALYTTMFFYSFLYDLRIFGIYAAFLVFYMLLGFLQPTTKEFTMRKKIMISSWDEPREGNILVNEEIDMTEILQKLDKYKSEKITITHIVCKALGDALGQAPYMNGKIAFGKYIPYKTVKISCLVEIEGGNDLASIAIDKVDEMSIRDIANLIKDKALRLKSKKDKEHKDRLNLIKMIPSWILAPMFDFVSLLTNSFEVNFGSGLKERPFGVALVTNVGGLGLRNAYAPGNLPSKVPVVITINKIEKKPMVYENEIKIRDVMNLNFWVDHRFLDGAKGMKLQKILLDRLRNFELYMDKEEKKQK